MSVSLFLFVSKFICIVCLDSTYKLHYDICPTYFTYYDRFQVHPCCCKWNDFILFSGGVGLIPTLKHLLACLSWPITNLGPAQGIIQIFYQPGLCLSLLIGFFSLFFGPCVVLLQSIFYTAVNMIFLICKSAFLCLKSFNAFPLFL